MPAAPLVSSTSESDFPELAAFATRHARAGEPVTEDAMPPEDRLRWILLENPARSDGIPFGWCARDVERNAIVGMLLCVPFRVGVGEFDCTVLMASKFYADPECRGAGIGPLMRFVREATRFPLLMTSANAIAGELYRKCGAYQIDGADHAMLGVSRPGPLAEEWLMRRTGSRAASRLLSMPAHLLKRRLVRSRGQGQLEILSTAGQAIQTSWPRPRNALAVLRDADYVRWRYFGREKGKDCYRFHAQDAEDRLVVARLIRSGHRSQIRVLEVLDVWPPADQRAVVPLVESLAEQYERTFDVLWLRSQPPEAEQALRGAGFLRHSFPAPLGWCIDRPSRLPTTRWYLMPGEAE
jgi:GNAT superfamily N-acetyltransferase